MSIQKTKKRVSARQKSAIIKRRLIIKTAAKYLPALVLFLTAFSIHTPAAANNSTKRVLSYATSISQSALLSETNSERTSNGVAGLNLNSLLNNAAQTKANDMVTRDYWSHITPDGNQPWHFIVGAGYQYTAAGENLAYGFGTSADTVTGWMNSPPHRENLLNSAFTDVGFGFANSTNYVTTGPETVVVAMYGAPQQTVQPVSTNNTQPESSAQAQQNAPSASKSSASSEPVIESIQTSPVQPQASQPKTKAANQSSPLANQTNQNLSAKPATVSRIQLLTGGNAAWSRTLLVLSIAAVTILWILQRGSQIRRMLNVGERFFLKHAHIDLTILGFITLGWTLLQASGAVR